ncbi:GGDEF domain-containing protein [Halalkalibacter sp. APA_J-10(15)]|uniref:GGDEF domain-containing protein n=1 Tax=Halalkalibacter sp. APA_J-10(15) TaxID=2933805 RepID=UPI001FF3CE79|nr:GGDEF domain-containing protein [Halalkalibacter sp. APA_J-10(15)]MCK0472891.1 GGDEF domain-containing protein [Halalkalibacter sp. APA_J-10(15)]
MGSSRKSALKLSGTFFIISFLWIYFSDIAVMRLTNSTEFIQLFQTTKGIIFISITSYILYVTTYKDLNQLEGKIQSITKHQQLLSQSERTYRRLNDGNFDTICMINQEGLITSANKQAEVFLQLPKNKKINLFEFFNRDEEKQSIIECIQQQQTSSQYFKQMTISLNHEEKKVDINIIPIDGHDNVAFFIVMKDMTSLLQSQQLFEYQSCILQRFLQSTELNEALRNVITILEQKSDCKYSIMIYDQRNKSLSFAAGQSIPSLFVQMVDGIKIGRTIGTCGPAILDKKTVICENIEQCSNWENFKAIALECNIKSCWSTPILLPSGEVIGTFVAYHSTITKPTTFDYRLMESVASVIGMGMAYFNNMQNTLKRERAQELLAKQTSDFMCIINHDYTITYQTSASQLFFQSELATLCDLTAEMTQEERKQVKEIIDHMFSGLLTHRDMLFTKRNNGRNHIYRIHLSAMQIENTIQGIVISLQNVTEEMELKDYVEQLTSTDSLTKLPNRKKLQNYLRELTKQEVSFYIALLDCLKLSRINESYGHQIGDEFLVQLSTYLLNLENESIRVFRSSGDEFYLVIESDDEVTARSYLNKVIGFFIDTSVVRTQTLHMNCNIGAVQYKGESLTVEELFKRCETTLAYAKRQGANMLVFYHDQMKSSYEEIMIETELYQAIGKEELILYYQPLVNVHTREVMSVEALIRWNHSKKGFIPPDQFIPIAEENGFIRVLGDWIIEQVCKQLWQWDQEGFVMPKVSINLSYEQLKADDFVSRVFTHLNTFNISGKRLTFEVTERILVEVSTETMQKVHALREAGITLAIDDFGVGYSSLSYIERFPVDTIKLDKVFVNEIPIPDKKLAIIKAVFHLCELLNIQIVVEGIESIEQLNQIPIHLEATIQGYFFAKPQTASELMENMNEIKQLVYLAASKLEEREYRL